VGAVAAQADRDLAIYRAWVDGARQVDLAERYGIDQSSVSRAIGRVLDAMPEPDRAREVRRTLDLVDDLVLVYASKAKAGNAAASREIRGLLALRGRFLGVDRREVEVSGTVEHAHTYQPPPESMGEVVSRILERQGRPVPAELVRLDQDGAP
jgi:hypothetical protein